MLYPMETSILWPQTLWNNPLASQGLGTPRYVPFDVSGLLPQSLFGATLGLSPFAAAPVATNPTIDVQAMTGFMQDVTSSSIRKLYDYLEKNSEPFKQLSSAIPIVQQAVEAYRTRDYATAFARVFDAYRQITALRSVVPDLPGLYEQTRP